jgi:hypothetical protein
MVSIFRDSKKSVLLITGFLMFFFPILITAQEFSGVTGIVTDSSGAVVPGVQVTLSDTKTSKEYTTTTTNQGVFTFNNIPPGVGYRISFTMQNFQTLVLNEVALGVGKTETQNVQLNAGQVSETVQVTSTSGDATLNTNDASIGNVIGQRQLRELPIQFRGNPASLLSLQPGVVGNNVGTTASNRVGSVTGSRADQGNITIDGIDSNDQASQQAFSTVGNVPIDSVQEFRAVSTNPGASEGRSSGGQIQLTTNSGSNDFHGSLREYFRSEATAANSFFNNRNGIARPKLRRHQFGGSIGGPLPFFNFGEGGPMFTSGKDRSFFFFDYEGRRDNSEVTASRAVPLQHFREGRIGYINNNPGCTFTSRIDTTPNCISFLTVAQVTALDPRGSGVNAALLSFVNSRYPVANDVTGGNGVNTGLFRFNAPVTRDDNTYTGRVDWNIGKKHRVFGRTTITRRDSTNTVALFPGDADSVGFNDKSYQWVAGHSWNVTSTFFNQATVGISNQIFAFPPTPSPAFPNSFTFGAGLTSPYPSQSFQDRDVLTPTIRDDATWTSGTHTIQFGGQFKPIRQKSTLINDFNFVGIGLGGGLTQLGAAQRPANLLVSTTARNLYDSAFTFLLGRFSTFQTNFVYDTNGVAQTPGTGRKRDYAYNEFEPYIQDNWRIRNDLTLTLGLRWHFYPAPYEVNGFQAANDVDFETLLNRRIQNAANGVSGASAEPFLSYSLNGKANDRPPLYDSDKNNFAPRVGFAYNPSFEGGVLGALFGQRKSSLRGGFSVVYDRVAGAVTFIQDQLSYVFDNSASRTFGSANVIPSLLNDPRFVSLTNLGVSNTAPTIANPFVPFVSGGVGFGLADSETNYAVAKNFEVPYSYQWSFGIQREVPGNFLLDVSYVGRKGKKLFAQADAAQVLNFRDNASGQFMLTAFNGIQTQLENGVPIGSLTVQPWIENQINPVALANYGAPCSAFGVANCTQLVAAFFGQLVEVGGTADLVQQLYFNDLLRPNVGLSSQFATNAYITNLGSSDYHGMLVSVQKRFSKGFEFDLNYTWSRAIDNQSSITNTVFGGLVCDVTNLDTCRGDADFDVRHLFNANGIWDLPLGRGRWLGRNMPRWLDSVVGGWTISGIVTARSGLPITSFSGAFPAGFLTNSPSVAINGGTQYIQNIRNEGTGIQFFDNPSAVNDSLRFPRHGETGNRNTFRSQHFANVDTAISKKFKLPWSESHRLTFRAEAYNLFNSNYFNFPDLSLNSTTFGRITSSLNNPREFQFALRYDF